MTLLGPLLRGYNLPKENGSLALYFDRLPARVPGLENLGFLDGTKEVSGMSPAYYATLPEGVVVKIVEDGISQNLMQTDYPEDTIQMLLLYSNSVFDESVDYSEDVKKRKVLAFISNVEILLHMEKGSLLETMLPMFFKNSKNKGNKTVSVKK